MSELPPLPAGYALDAVPPLPAGYKLDDGGPKADITANNVVRSGASGVPVIGGVLNQIEAATNAALAPVLNPLFKPEDQLQEPTFAERRAHSLRDQEGMDKSFEAAHPIVDTAAKLTGGVASMAPVMAAAPAAFGLTGTVPQMVAKGAASGAGLSAADALTRGENPIHAAETGAIVGGAAGPVGRVIGKGVAAIADRLRPPEVVPQNTATVGNTEIPLRESQVTGNPAASAEEQIMLRGGRGDKAQEVAQKAEDLQNESVNQARDEIGKGFSPAGAQVANNAQEAGQAVSSGIADKAAQDKSLYQTLYKDFGDLEGSLPRAAFDKIGSSIKTTMDAGSHPIPIDDVLTPYANRALADVEKSIGPQTLGGADALKSSADKEAFDKMVAMGIPADKARASLVQDAPKSNGPSGAAAPPSLLQFIASKGGLGPDAELEAIGAHGHTVNVEGVGRRKLVRQGGWPLDYAREAAEEAGYLRGGHNGTSTVNDLLDAMDAEMRGQKRYPEGFEGHVGKRESAAMSEREQAEFDRHMHGFESDLADAGHGKLGADVKQRAIHLMANEGMDADTAVEHALRQLEQEDNAVHSSGFPGDRIAQPKSSVGQLSGSEKPNGVSLKDVDQARKRLVSFYGQAKSSGNAADMKATQGVIKAFDDHIEKTIDAGLFSGSDRALPTLRAARQQFAYYKNTYGPQGSGDFVGQKMAKILGKYDGQAASPDDVANFLYGSTGVNGKTPTIALAQRLRSVLGKHSDEWTAVRQGLWKRLTEPAEGRLDWGPQKISEALHEFLNGKGKELSHVLYSAQERTLMKQLAGVYKQMIPVRGTTNPSGTAPMLAKIAGGARHTLLPLLGFSHGGVPGAAVAYGIDKGLAAMKASKDARRATQLFYGQQAKRAANPNIAKTAGFLAQGALPDLNQRRSSQ